eukprot:4630248-Prorocentrum_lima.AAC.1
MGCIPLELDAILPQVENPEMVETYVGPQSVSFSWTSHPVTCYCHDIYQSIDGLLPPLFLPDNMRV